jgi:glycine cleavage system regulatory protein
MQHWSTLAMRTFLVFTFIGDDKPGLVESLSNTVASHGGNWLDSRLAQLAGKFAGIIRVSVPSARQEALTSALHALESKGLNVVVEHTAASSDDDRPLRYVLQVMGLDRPGIVKEVSHALATRNINVLELDTHISSAPMTGEPLFNASALVAAPTSANIDELCDQLDAIANELTVEIDLKPQQG